MPQQAKRERVYRWYVEPLNAETNAVVAEMAGDPDENFIEEQDVEGQNLPVPLWRVTFKQMSALRSSRKKLKLRFNCYSQEGNGKIEPSYV